MKDFNLKRIRLTDVFNFLMLFYTLLACRNLYERILLEMAESGLLSEFLVNYQGGFVRRGFLGEVLYQVCPLFSLDIISVIYIFSIVCFIGVVVFFVYQFLKKHYNWWILPLGIFLATGWVIRKDYFMILMLIAIVYSYVHVKRILPKMLLVVLLEIMLIFTHEAFFFFGTLFIMLLLLRDKNLNLKMSFRILYASLLFFSFLLVCYYKGSDEIGLKISDSWVSLLPENFPKCSGTINSLGWESLPTFKFHFRVNFVESSYGLIGLLVRPIALFFIYYLSSQILFVFRKPNSDLQKNDKTLLSSILLFQFVMLIPMFTILSCDCGRVVLYWLSSSFILFLLVPRDTLWDIFPKRVTLLVGKINNRIEMILPPTKGFMGLLILFITITPVGFHLDWAINHSIFGVVGSFVSNVFRSFMIQF